MEAIVLAGGRGTRLKAAVPELPKPMAPIGNRPFLEILLEFLARQHFTRIVLSLGYKAQYVVDHFGDRFRDMDIIYEIEQDALGTGGALRRALARCASDPVFVFNGDTYLELDVDVVMAQWREDRLPIVVARQVPDTARYGRLDTTGNRIVGFIEKGMAGPGLINAGCYVFPREISVEFPPEQAFSLEQDMLVKSVSRLSYQVFISTGRFIDIGIPEDYARAQVELRAA